MYAHSLSCLILILYLQLALGKQYEAKSRIPGLPSSDFDSTVGTPGVMPELNVAEDIVYEPAAISPRFVVVYGAFLIVDCVLRAVCVELMCCMCAAEFECTKCVAAGLSQCMC